MLTAIGILGGLTFAVLYPIIPWGRIFNITAPDIIAEAAPATAVFVACFLINMPLSLVQRVQMGYQEGMTNNLWIVFGNILGLIALLVAIQARAGLPWLVLAMAGAPVFAALLNNIALFGVRRRWLRPRLSSITQGTARKIVSVGFLFFVLQVAVTAGYASDNIVVAQILGPEGVTQYSVPLRLFQIAPQVLGMMLYPLWPAYGEAIARGDVAWVRKTLKRSILIGLAINIPPALFLIAFGTQVVDLWIGSDAITPTFLLLLGFGVWTTMNSFTGPIAMLFNGATVIRFQVICSSLMAVTNLTLSIVLTHLIGLPGPIWASIIAVTICILIPSALFIPKLLARMESAEQAPA
jgi:O-antigen/teichoic acid export membrane protein